MIHLKKEQQKSSLREEIKNLKRNNAVLQSVIHELVMNPESEKAKGIIEKIKKHEELKKK